MPPTLDHVLTTLRHHRADLERLGVRHAAVFGSVARGDQGPESDVDLAVDLEEGRSILDLAEVADTVGGLLHAPVDVVSLSRLRAETVVHAF